MFSMNPATTSPTVNILVPAGALGAGINAVLVERGMVMGVDAIACDAGSTDSGPSYLYRGVSKVSREAVKHDLAILMAATHAAKIPLLIGSCGTSGADAGVDWTAEIVVEIARELGIEPKIALLYSEQDGAVIKQRNAAGKVHPLPPLGPLANEVVDACHRIVALMGPEPYIAALEAGADIVLGGRTTDTAVLAAVPLMRGCDVAAAWHAGKTGECGGLCTLNPRGGGVILRVGQDGFEVEPLASDNHCTPHTISAHMLYENSDPFRLIEPGGVLDVEQARYEAIDDRITRVAGMSWSPRPYTMKLEGASGGYFQTIMIVGIADPFVLRSLNLFEERLKATLHSRIENVIGVEAGQYDISLRIYGWNALTGEPVEDGAALPREVGVMFIATAETQAMATRIAKTCNPTFFHFPLEPGIELPSYGFPFTPAEIERGQVYEFRLNHVVETIDGFELVRTAWIDLAQDKKLDIVHAQAE